MSDITITLPRAGIRLTGWKAARITRSIETLTSAFEFVISERYLDADQTDEAVLTGGVPVLIHLDDDLVVTGYIDDVKYVLTAREHTIVITGRGLCQDLIDCSGTAGTSPIFENTRLDDICRRFAQTLGTDDFGRIGVNVSPGLQQVMASLPTLPFQQVAIDQTPYEIIERNSRYVGALAFENEDGSLNLAVAGDEIGSSGVAIGMNIESAVVAKSTLGRFTALSAYLHTLNDMLDIGVNLKPGYTGVDPQMVSLGRYRPFNILSEQPGSDRTYLERRVLWQIARAYGRSRQIRVLVDSWYDADAVPWQINRQIPTSIPHLKVPANTPLLVVEVAFILDEHGTHAELLLAPREGYLPEPLVLQQIAPDIAA